MEDGRNHQAEAYLKRQQRFKNLRSQASIQTAKLDISYHSTQINYNDWVSEKDYRFSKATADLPDESVHSCHPYQTDFPDGREKDPHITVLYGLKNEQDYFRIREMCQEMKPIELEIGPVSAFRNPDTGHDVLIHEIISEDLMELNASIAANFDHYSSFPDYKPHMTLAYIKKGSLVDLEGNETSVTGSKIKVNGFVFSHKDGYKLPIPLGPEQQDAPVRWLNEV